MKCKKGVSEYLPATLFVLILLFVFIIAMVNVYSVFIDRFEFIEKNRASSTIAEYLFLKTDGIVSDANYIDITGSVENVKIDLKDNFNGSSWSFGNINENITTVTSSTVYILIYDGLEYHPGRVDVFVG
jgi:hypothetical protein